MSDNASGITCVASLAVMAITTVITFVLARWLAGWATDSTAGWWVVFVLAFVVIEGIVAFPVMMLAALPVSIIQAMRK